MKTSKDMLDFFDKHYDMANLMELKTKDFTPVVDALELLLKQMSTTREISEEIKKELGECSEKAFTKAVKERLEPKLRGFKKAYKKMDDTGFHEFLFLLPDRKGRIFFELMERLEDAGELPFNDKSKRSRIDAVTEDLKKYIEEIKAISKPFVPAPIDKKQTIIFTVKFKYRKSTWRTIELKASQTLEDLHDAIQDALDWDDDHLYSFYMDNKFYSKDPDAEFTCPYEPEGRKTADIEAGAFAFRKGQKFAYLFDFGDDHRFEIEVIDFGEVEKGKKYPVLLDSKGDSPEQYPDWEE